MVFRYIRTASSAVRLGSRIPYFCRSTAARYRSTIRLVEACDGPGGLEFRLTQPDLDDGSSPIPPYAVLSHTWGPDAEELSLRDLVDGAGKAKAGYDKLRFCAHQARRDGLTHFWIDTCCIDKSNSAELTEALNSMFRWYRRAERCYVFLPDVASPSSPEPWIPSFRASRWFTRGWTLQELIAPSTVQFFAKDGSLLGDKHSLLPLVAEITGIAEAAITAEEPLDAFSLQERFRWAETRQTKREEDWAYSLLGIFGVFIPPIYGEGRQNAERRLRNEIRATLAASIELEPREAHCEFHWHSRNTLPTYSLPLSCCALLEQPRFCQAPGTV